jgi:cell wall-associated NlpC family hydrolase
VDIVETAMEYLGIRYLDGGSDPRGFDCSGFTQYVLAAVGTVLPRAVRDQFSVGRPVDLGAQAPGDLVFFTTTSASVSHVGIIVEGDRFVHAPSSRGVVRVERMSLPYWARRLAGIRRVAGTDSNN